MRHVSDEIDGLIQGFVEKHDLDVEQQFHCLVEEVGEVSEAILKEKDDFEVERELADVLFVARTMHKLLGGTARHHLKDVAEHNIRKSVSRKGDKISKSKRGDDL